MDHHGREANGN
jgi:hypothetical protein